jgi:hypothetical protein
MILRININLIKNKNENPMSNEIKQCRFVCVSIYIYKGKRLLTISVYR